MPTRFSDMGGVLAFAMLGCCIPHSECPKPGLETNIANAKTPPISLNLVGMDLDNIFD